MSAADRLAAIRARLDAATPGPWSYTLGTPTMGGTTWSLRVAGKPGIRAGVVEYQHGDANAEFITHARTDIPALLAAVEAALALHQPREEAVLDDPECLREECDHDGECPPTGSVTVCAACWEITEAGYEYFSESGIPDQILYPCATARTITEALS